jgi:hypothetical protein
VVVYGNEYYFGGGIQSSPAGTTPYGRPLRTVELGVTHIPREVFEDYLRDIAPRYTAETYRLLTHNCNNFSHEVAQFLVGTGAGVPDYILNLPAEVMSSPMGPLIMPMIQNLESTLRSNNAPQATQFVPTPASVSAPAKREAPAPAPAGKASKEAPSSAPAPAPAAPAADPLGSARVKVQEEVMREFAAIMASGTLRASEAAALAMRRVMERHGDGATMQQG